MTVPVDCPVAASVPEIETPEEGKRSSTSFHSGSPIFHQHFEGDCVSDSDSPCPCERAPLHAPWLVLLRDRRIIASRSIGLEGLD